MELFLYYIAMVICCLVLFIFNNYLVKKNKLDYQWKITADLVWLFALLPGINLIVFIFVFAIVLHNLTKNFIEQNEKDKK